jgi:hypothetical protein
LAGLALLVNGSTANGTYDMKGKTIKLGNDIALNDTTNWENWASDNTNLNQWILIGNQVHTFQGTCDGDGKVISGIYIDKSSDDQGLFGRIGSNGTIKNLKVTASYIKAGNYVGGLVGRNDGIIDSSFFIGNIFGGWSVGGLASSNYGTISNSYAAGNVSAMGSGSSFGGLVGWNNGSISNSYAAVNVLSVVGYPWSAGGLVGFNTGTGTVNNCYAMGNVFGTNNVGGLIGNNDGGAINNSYAIGSVSGNENVGGLVGNNGSGAILLNSYYNKETSCQADEGKGIGKTTAEMQSKTTYEDWDFESIWDINEDATYPYLRNLPTPVSNFNSAPNSCSGGSNTPIRLPQTAVASHIISTKNGFHITTVASAMVRIYNARGNMQYATTFATGDYNVSLAHLPKGIYIVNVKFSDDKKNGSIRTIRVAVQ